MNILIETRGDDQRRRDVRWRAPTFDLKVTFDSLLVPGRVERI